MAGTTIEAGPEALTEREREVLGLVCEGLSLAQIAKQLHRSRKTIATHRLSLGRKLGAHNRVELVNNAMRLGLIAPPAPADTGLGSAAAAARDATPGGAATPAAGRDIAHHLPAGPHDRELTLSGPIGNWNWDLASRTPHFSDEMYEVIGHPKGSLRQDETGLIQAVHPDDRANLLASVARCVRTGMSFRLLHRHVDAAGRAHWSLTQASVFRDAKGQPLRLSGTSQRCQVADPPHTSIHRP